MIEVVIFLSVSLSVAVIGSIVIWGMDALRAEEIESHPATGTGPRHAALAGSTPRVALPRSGRPRHL
ncbi:hypothetical protein NODU109028_05070 [Nocardioides dubius]|uniref:Uncharacterized protein n=1 Tax=Nocardioides dubius TaxID=317019 RepID=A0ABP4EA04_9ACTN